jgi:beta-glucanase (GH16 family)
MGKVQEHIPSRKKVRRRHWFGSGALVKLIMAGVMTAGAGASMAALRTRGSGHSAVAPHSSTTPAARRRGAAVGLQPLAISGSWKLVLNAPFTGTSLNTSLWRAGWFGTGVTGPINSNETACYRPGNVIVPGDGTVHMLVTAQYSRCKGATRAFSGAVLSTNPHDGRRGGGFEYRYGVLEAKVYVPGTGSTVADWPAIITLGQVWPRDGEDDVMENLEGAVCSHFHSPGNAPGGNLGGCDPFFRPGWHIVSSNWEPGSVTWYYDGVQIAHITTGVTAAPMYIAMVNSVSSKAPGIARPSTMRVAYVRVWQQAPYVPRARARR